MATASRAAALRREFDESFAQPTRVRATDSRHFLAIRIGADPYALELAEIAGIQSDRPVVPVPGTFPAWLGLAGIRGDLVPVYSLALLLGLPAGNPGRWTVLCNAAQPFGLAFDVFEGHLDIGPAHIAALSARDDGTLHIRAVGQTGEGSRPIVDIPSIAIAIARRCEHLSVSKEA